MLDDYEQYEIECERIRESNKELLDDFAAWLRKSNLTVKTVNKHVDNIDFYINEYLLYEDATDPQEGVYSVSMFLGYWFIKKAMWASAASIKRQCSELESSTHDFGFCSRKARIDAGSEPHEGCGVSAGRRNQRHGW